MNQIPQGIYHARNLACKNPFGAVWAGQDIQFCVFPKRASAVLRVSLWIASDAAQDPIEYEMTWDGLALERERFCARVTLPDCGLYWYYFSVQTAAGMHYLVRGTRGRAVGSAEVTRRFQLTVYAPNAQPVDWYGSGITYQIFPDRFYRGASFAPKQMPGRWMHEHWDEYPVYTPDENGEILNNDFFGGTLRGIMEKLPYLQTLGVTTLYFNPIFEASANHRYDTGDYHKVDPYLGTLADFKTLCKAAREKGMRIILDGVFSHTGRNSRYFNGNGTYDSVGAYQSLESPYAQWYDFQKWPDQYTSWWGIYTLPQVNEMNDAYLDFIVHDENSVVRQWLRHGASGWRLDVADELPDAFIAALRAAAKEEKADAIILGEVWEDASNKIAYSERRQYFLGQELDSVMNYPLRDAIIAFVKGGDAAAFAETIEELQENYPREVFYNLMNHIGTHDTARILTVLGATSEEMHATPAQQAVSSICGERLVEAKRKLFMAVCVQFGMPGSPTIYYGDEIGMQGFRDPHCRQPFAWGREDKDIQAFYQRMCDIRNGSMALKAGALVFEEASGAVLGFWRTHENENIYVAINRDVHCREIVVAADHAFDLLSGEHFYHRNADGDLLVTLAPAQGYMIQCEG